MEPTSRIELEMHSYQECVLPLALCGQEMFGAPDRIRTRSSLVKSQEPFQLGDRGMEPVRGFEPLQEAPKTSVLPLDDTGMWWVLRESNPVISRLRAACSPILLSTQDVFRWMG